MFNVSRLFIPQKYTKNSLIFNSPFSPLALLPIYIYIYTPSIALYVILCQIHTNQKRCNLLLIFRQYLPISNIVISSIPNHMSWLQPSKGSLHFILTDNSNYDFDIKVELYEFVGFVNDVIDYGCLDVYFVLRLRRKRKTHSISTFIP